MGYALGVDLGTTYTAAAIFRDGRAESVSLGTRSLVIPSLVYLSADGEFMVGEVAARRGAADPTRLARAFKRRLGDPVPLLLGGTPTSAQALIARVLKAVVAMVAEREGSMPDVVVLTRPANWGPFKLELFAQALQLAELDVPSTFTLTEPEAAAISYAATSKVDVGGVIAVYDLGGGTFDSAVLRKSADGFEILGIPTGIEQLGGIDFDEAIFGYVMSAMSDKLAGLDQDDPTFLEGLARLRADCVEAKEALSLDTEIAIPVNIGPVHESIRLTRSEFENLIRPSLSDTVTTLRRAIDGAELENAGVLMVLLVGGSSRIPLIGEIVRNMLGLPIALDTNPKQTVVLGAALYGGSQLTPSTLPPPVAVPKPAPVVPERPARRPRTGLLVGGVVAALVLIIGLIVVLRSGAGSESAGGTATTATGSTTTVPASITIPKAPSPVDVDTLAFSRTDQGNTDIYLVSTDGTGLQRITSTPVPEDSSAWSPDRRTLAYTRGGDSWQLRIVNANGGADLLVASDMKPGGRASWAPDGGRLAYVTESASSGQTDLAVFDLRTRQETPLTADALVEGDPAWSPDGRSIAFWRQDGTNQDLWVADVESALASAADGAEVKLAATKIATNPAADVQPTWSPDGTKLAFASQRAGDHWQIFTVSPQGGPTVQLTNAAADSTDPAWSPDGTHLAFASTRDDPASDVYVMNADGTNVRRVTNRDGFDGHPAWSSGVDPSRTESPIACNRQYAGTTVTILSRLDVRPYFAEFESCTGATIAWQQGTALASDVEQSLAADKPPDLVNFVQPGVLAEQARIGKLVALPSDIQQVERSSLAQGWEQASTVDGSVFGIPYFAVYKSLIWYSPAAFAARGYTVPTTLDELRALSDRIVSEGGVPWCAGVESGSATGWPATDWIEDFMLHLDGPQTYDDWIAHKLPFNDPKVIAVADAVGGFLKNESYVGGVKALTTTAFTDGAQAIADGRCFLDHQASHLKAAWPQGTTFGADGAIDAFPMPVAQPGDPSSMLTAGDIMAATNNQPATLDAMRFLGSLEFANAQAKTSGGFSPRRDFDTGNLADSFDRKIAEFGRSASVLRFDGADAMPTVVGQGTFPTGATAWLGGTSTQQFVDYVEASWPPS